MTGASRVGGRPAPKVCVACGRQIEWRKKWARDWEQVRYCSKRCRSNGVRLVDLELEASILDLLARRANGATICPSEAAKAVAAERALPDSQWRELMEPTRAASRRLVARGLVEMTQRGRVVDPSTARGPVRIRRTTGPT